MKRRENAHCSIESYILADGAVRWRVRARIEGKLTTVSSGLKSNAEAEEYAKAYRVLKAEGTLRRGMTLTQFGPGFHDGREARGLRDVPNERNRWKNHVAGDRLGKIPLSILTRPDIVAWLGRLEAKKLERQTIKNIFNNLRSALQEALDHELVERNVASDVKVRKGRQDVSEDDLGGVLDLKEQLRLFEVCELPMHVAKTAAALFLGARESELVWLRWEDVDLEKKQVAIRKSRRGLATKGGKVRRTPILDPLLPILASLPRKSEWVFTGHRGGRCAEGKALVGEVTWRKMRKLAKFGRRVRWHDLRHTCATSLLAGWWGRKWTLEEVCKMLGHSSVKVTERYARKLDQMARDAADQTFQESSNGLFGGALDRGVFRGAIHQNRTDDLRFTKPEQTALVTSTSVQKSSVSGTPVEAGSSNAKRAPSKPRKKVSKETEGLKGNGKDKK